MSDLKTNVIHTGDCFDVLADLPAESVHAVVTDPPYGLAFMGRDWDDFEPKEYQEWCEQWAAEVKRVLKPGGHLLAFSGNRTHHRLFTGVEDAGFEIRDTLTWHYGSGFPKATDVSKTIDKRRDDEEEQRVVCRWLRERINESEYTVDEIADHFGYHSRMVDHWAARDTDSQPSTPKLEQWSELKRLMGFGDEMDDLVNWLNDRKGEPADTWDEREVVATLEDNADRNVDILQGSSGEYEVTEPTTDAAKQWDGFKTGLKPATEYVVMARKPFDGATVDCVLEHGTGALNIDGTRIEGDNSGGYWPGGGDIPDDKLYGDGRTHGNEQHESGRYPSNVVFDETEAERLDRNVGDTSSGGGQSRSGDESASTCYTDEGSTNFAAEPGQRRGGSGGPSRYFYTSKASKAERTEDGSIANAHPTVKPQDLMEWLVKLVTAEYQIVLDPFAGSGTTCKAAKAVGRKFVGIEKQPKWADVARARAGLSPNDPSHVRDTDDSQQGLEQF